MNSGRDADSATGTITFYIAIDGAWVSLGSREMTARKVSVFSNGTETRYCLTAEQLESVYRAYGFVAADMTENSRLFPHARPGNPTIYGNRMVMEYEGVLYSPMLTDGVDCDVYYLPNAKQNSYSDNRDSYASSNSFYTVEVMDPGNKVYGQNESLPPTAYVLTGKDYTVKVRAAEGVTWQCVDKNGTKVDSTEAEGIVSFTINNISQPYTVSPVLGQDETLITYYIELPHEPSDPEYRCPTIEGKEIHQLVEPETLHDVLAPSHDEYFYYHGKYLGTATFQGWQVEGTNTLLQPGDKHDLTDHNGSLTLKAQWETKEGGVQQYPLQSSIVNFYVALTAIPEGGTSWTGSITSSSFTGSVFSSDCGVLGQLAIEKHLYQKDDGQQYFVLGDTSGVDLNKTHTSIVSNLTQGYSREGNDDKQYTFKLNFPSDEEVLRHIRSLVSGGNHTLTLNGKTILVEDLTSANFTIKWYVFKVDVTDGWHVDGILVAKTGHMRITKTFSGDQDVVKKIKNGDYAIQLAAQPITDFTPPHSGYTLTLANAVHDPASDTYTWQVEVDQYLDYKVTELNYHYQNEQPEHVQTAARYRVYNSKFSGQNTDGYQDYTGGDITVTGQSAAQSGQQLTLSFINTYTKPGTMSIIKMDALTQSPMPNIEFEIKKVGYENFTLYNLGNSHYSIESADGNSPTPTNTIVTDASGQAFLYLGAGSGTSTFTFTEKVPKGYDNPGKITVVMDAAGGIISASAANSKADNRVYTQVNGSELQINNYSRLVPLTVKKNWLDGENSPVTLQLYYNGQNMAADFKKELSGDTWTDTFKNYVPLYMGGSLVEYSLLETEIGDWSYSEQLGGDGYRYYDVKYTPMKYLNDSGNVTDDPEEAKQILLEVSNRRSTGQLSISKLDQRGQPLPGAVFYLYPAENTDDGSLPDCVQVKKDQNGNYIIDSQAKPHQAVSDSEGRVSFVGIPTGNYYLIEHQSPPNYYGTDSLFLVELQSEFSFVLKQWKDTGWVTVQSRSISNELQYVSVNIQKIVKGSFGLFSKSFEFSVSSDRPMKESPGYMLSNGGKTATFSLRHREGLNIIAEVGSTLTITETNPDGYAMSIALADGTPIDGSYIVPSDGTRYVDIVVTNTKNANIDTGIVLDSLPYVLILALAGTGGLLLIKKGRRRRDR